MSHYTIRATGPTVRSAAKCLSFYISGSIQHRYFGICFRGVCIFDTHLLQFNIDLRTFSL